MNTTRFPASKVFVFPTPSCFRVLSSQGLEPGSAEFPLGISSWRGATIYVDEAGAHELVLKPLRFWIDEEAVVGREFGVRALEA